MSLVAERIVQQFHANDAYQIFEVNVEGLKALRMVRILVEGHEAVARTARKIFPVAAKADDQPTADLLTQRLDIHEKTAWMLRSLLEE